MTLPATRRRSGRLASSSSKISVKERFNIDFEIDFTPTLRTDICLVKCKGKPQEWCSHCHNGSTMLVGCDKCIRWFCDTCVKFPPGNRDEKFVCPACHIWPGGKGVRNSTPYPFPVPATTATRRLWPYICIEPLAIIAIQLEGMNAEENPAKLAYQELWTYMRGNVAYIELDYNFFTPDKEASYAMRLNAVLTCLESGELKHFTRFAIYLYTHSTPDTGLLHTAPENKQASGIDWVLSSIFPMRFQNLLNRDPRNLLVLLSCGGVVNVPASKASLCSFAKNKLFSHIMTFSSNEFMPFFSNRFFTQYTINKFLHLIDNPDATLVNETALGVHSDVFCIQFEHEAGAITPLRYVWSHPVIKPLGTPAPVQCQKCQGLRLWEVDANSHTSNKVVLKCKVCHNHSALSFNRPPSAQFIRKWTPENEGLWLKQVEQF